MDDQTQSNPTFQMHSKELTPNPREEDGAYSDHTGLNSETHKNLATTEHIKVSERKNATKDAISNNAQESDESNQDSEEKVNEKELLATYHLSQFQWDVKKATLRFYIQKWYELLEDSRSRKALKVLQQLVPTTYRDRIQDSSSLEESLKDLATYCSNEEVPSKLIRNKARKRKSPESSESRKPGANEENTPVKKKPKHPCSVCAEPTHSTLLGCPQLKKYLPG